VPQSGGLYSELSLRANLRLKAELWNEAPETLERSPSFEHLGLRALMDKRVAHLSGGYRRLATVALAMSPEPDWLVLDEPFAGLDPENGVLVREVLSEASERIRLVVIALPTPDRISFITRVLTIEAGELQ
jgi:ABC-type multidrug transport system ATPase subunit